MLKHLRSTILLAGFAVVGVALIACTAGTATPGTGGSPQPERTAEITTPTSGLKISATIASVTLGDECASAAKGLSQGDCAVGGCQSSCQSSNVQIAFTATVGTKAASVQIVSVSLVESDSDAVVDTLTANNPQVWNGNRYSTWDQNVTPGGDLKASYDLTAPQWSKIDSNGAGETSRGTSSYSRSFRLLVTLQIDGVQIILESTDVNRQPQVMT